MSVSTTQSLIQFTVSAYGQTLAIPFPIQNNSDLVVKDTNATTLADTLLTMGTDYTVTGAGGTGCSVVLAASSPNFAVGDTITVQRQPPFTQPTIYADGTKYPAAVTNASLDWIVYQIQALNDLVARTLAVPSTSPAQAPIPITARKGMVAGWDNNGNFTSYNQSGIPNWFAASAGPIGVVFLGAVTARTGGTATCLDGLNISLVTGPVLIFVSIGGDSEAWLLRPKVSGDPTTGSNTVIIPVTNPNNYIYARYL